MKQKILEKKKTKIENISDIFREEEIALINQRKSRKEQDIIKLVEKELDKIHLLYQKIKLNLTIKEKTLTNYIAL